MENKDVGDEKWILQWFCLEDSTVATPFSKCSSKGSKRNNQGQYLMGVLT